MGNFGGWGYNEGVRDGDALGWGWGSCPQTRCRAVTPTSRRCCIKPGWKICSGGRASLGQPGLFGLRGGCFGSCCRCVLEERGMSGAGKKKNPVISSAPDLSPPCCRAANAAGPVQRNTNRKTSVFRQLWTTGSTKTGCPAPPRPLNSHPQKQLPPLHIGWRGREDSSPYLPPLVSRPPGGAFNQNRGNGRLGQPDSTGDAGGDAWGTPTLGAPGASRTPFPPPAPPWPPTRTPR